MPSPRRRKVTIQGQRNEPPSRDANAAVRVEKAIRLRCHKLTYAQIAVQCGYGSAQSAHKAVQRELDRRISRAVDELRREEAEMYDDLHRAIYPLAVPEPITAPDPTSGSEELDDDDDGGEDGSRQAQSKARKPSLFAVDRVLAISAARRALLGMDLKVETGQAQGQMIVIGVPQAVYEAV